MTGDAVLALANVESAYGPIKAIRGVSLEVRRGEIAAVLGVTESRICQLHSQSIARLRSRLRQW